MDILTNSTTPNPSIFREYDIRGVVDKDLTPAVVTLIGLGYGTYARRLGLHNIIVAHDNRLSSERYRDALIDGLRATGLNVLDVGLMPTPVFYFSIVHYGKDGGIIVTGSHNPVEYNGFKMCNGVLTLMGEEILQIQDIINQRIFETGTGYVERKANTEVINRYFEEVKKRTRVQRRLRVVVDAGNGTTGIVGPALLGQLGCEVVPLYCELDGTFPHHLPDPEMPENVQDLIQTVQKEKADLGIAYDGDGDRVGIVDDTGKKISADRLLVLFASEVLSRQPGAKVIFDVKCSQVLFEEIERLGGTPIMWKTGHSIIKRKMADEGAPLAGEMSGHIFFGGDYYGFDDGIFASCKAVAILSHTHEKVSQVFSRIPELFSTPEMRLACPDEEKFRIVDSIRDYFKAHYNVIDIDGVRVLFEGGWGLVRASNTHGAITVRVEADTPERLARYKTLVRDQLARFPSVNLARFD